MVKETYIVSEGSDATSSRDASFKSCVCALLVFLAICVIILVAGIKWTKNPITEEVRGKEANRMTNKTTTTRPKIIKPTAVNNPSTEGQKKSSRSEKITAATNFTPLLPTTNRQSSIITTKTITESSKAVTTTGNIQSTAENKSDEKLFRLEVTNATTSFTLFPSKTKPAAITQPSITTTTEPNKVATETVNTESTKETKKSQPTITEPTKVGTTIANTQSAEENKKTQRNITTTTTEPTKVAKETVSTQSTDEHKKTLPNITTTTEPNKVATETINTQSTEENKETQPNITTTTTEPTKVATETVNTQSADEHKKTESSITLTTTEPSKVATEPVNTQTTDKHKKTQSNITTTTEPIKVATETLNTQSTEGSKETQPSITTTELAKVATITTNAQGTEENRKTQPGITTTTEPTKVTKEPENTQTTEETKTTQPNTITTTEPTIVATTVNTESTEENKITDKKPHMSELSIANTNSTLLFREPELSCSTVECKSAASRMLSFMNHSVDACNDFYEYACGGMPVDNVDSDTWKRLSEQIHLINNNAPTPLYLKSFKIFYDSCVSHEYEFNYQKRIDGVLKLVKEVGEILDKKPPEGTIDMTDLFANLILRQSLPFIDIDIDIDKQTSKFILKLTLPKPTSILKESRRWSALTEAQKRCLDEQRHEFKQLNLDLTKIYELYLDCQKDHTIYVNSIQNIVQALGYYEYFHLNNTFEENQKMQDLRTTIEWDILDNLNILPSPSTIRQTVLFKNYTIFKISDLKIHYKLLDWNKLFNKVIGRTLEDNTTVQVYFPDYFSEIFQKLNDVGDWKLNNALIAIYAHNLYENLVIPQAKHTRERYCLILSSKLFQDVSSNLYMKTWPKTEIEKSQKYLTEVFDRLKQNLAVALQKEEWLADDSLIRTLVKLNKLKLTLNKEEDSYNSEDDLNSKYSAVTLTEDFQDNAVKMLQMDRRMRYALVGKPSSTDYLWSYFVNVYDSEPTSFYSKELIMAPLGMVKQLPKGLPGYITMARIGLSLAKEIGRHFDPIGIQNGMTLTPEAEPSYEFLEDLMENESLFNVTRHVGHQIVTFMADPKLSANERIADNTGFRLISDSFDSYGVQALVPWVSTSFSIEQIFYITVAQEYCKETDMAEFMQQLFESEILPASLRVENIVTNSKQFSQAFDCPKGSPMNNNPSKIQFPHLTEEEEEEAEEGVEEEEGQQQEEEEGQEEEEDF